MTEGLKAAEGSSLSSGVFGSSVRTARWQFVLMKSIFRLLRRNNQPHFKDRDAKLRTFLGTFAKNSLSRVGFNRNYDNFLSFTPPFLPKSEVAHTRLHPLGPVYLFRKMSTYSGKCLSIQDDPGVLP